jgi:uncharacterized protein YydD (DUF2326 family)
MNEFDNIIVDRIDDLNQLIEFNNYIGREDRTDFLRSEIKYLENKLK